jgi:succinoglycan biosynthesis protein ExoO
MTADVSVIVATYNVASYIERAICSALAQEGVTVEIVLVDDCSTDGTWGIVTGRLNDPRLKCIRLPYNQGPGAARNAAIAAATGAWLAILDGDDVFIDPQRLFRCVNNARNAKADMAVDNLMVFRECDGAIFPMFSPAKFQRTTVIDLAAFIRGNQNFFCGYSLGYLKPVFSAEFLRRHNLAYDSSLRIGEDYLFMCDVLAKGAVCAVDHAAGYAYTVRRGSVSHRLRLEDIDRIRTGNKKFISRHKLEPAAAKAQLCRERGLQEIYAFTLLVEAIKQKNLGGVFKAFRLSPLAAINLWRPLWARMFKHNTEVTGVSGNG